MYAQAIEPHYHGGAVPVIARAQSLLTMHGRVGPLLPVHQAQTVVDWNDAHLRRQHQPRNRLFHFFRRKRASRD